jgi:RHS repeat-associated protein
MEKDNEIKGNGNSLDFGARIYDTRLGRWLSLDPLQAKYPNLSPYNFCANNPIFYIDPDGKKLKPSDAFLKTEIGAVMLQLKNSNSIYKEIVKDYSKSNKHHLVFQNGEADQVLLPNGLDAWTKKSWFQFNYYGKMMDFQSKQQYDFDKTMKVTDEQGNSYSRNKIDIAALLIHEGIHSLMNAKGEIESGEGDNSHKDYGKYFDKSLSALKEYNTDNKLGYSDNQLTEITLFRMQDSDKFKEYINGKVTDSKGSSSYEEEVANLNSRVSALVWKKDEPKK